MRLPGGWAVGVAAWAWVVPVHAEEPATDEVAAPAEVARRAVGGRASPELAVVAAPRVADRLAPLGVRPATPEDPPDEAALLAAGAAALTSAWDHYRDLRLDEARRTAVAARTTVVDAGPGSPDLAGLERRLLRFIALVALATGDESAARGALWAALASDPDERSDPGRFPPRFQQLEDGLRAELVATPGRWVAVTTDPPGATVHVDGERGCEAPCRVELRAGPHRLRATLPAHRDAVVVIDDDQGAPREAEAVPIALSLETTEAAVRRALADGDPASFRAWSAPVRAAVAEQLGAGRVLRVDRDDRGRWAGAAVELESGRVEVRHLSADLPPEAALEALEAWARGPSVGPDELARPASGASSVATARPGDDGSTPIWKSPWLWTAVGILVIGAAATATGLALRGEDQPDTVVVIRTP